MWGHPEDWWWTRWVFQRSLGLLYLVAFASVVNQFRPLLGERGLLPVRDFVERVPFRRAPSLFYWKPTDRALALCGWAGVGLSLLALSGLSDAFGMAWSVGVWALLFVLYLSFVNVGQTFYAFGWESILLEAGFFAIFLGPSRVAAPVVVVWMLRWLLFRVMFGAGLIKLRADPCWRQLTCLYYHYETQPIPNPLSRRFHELPMWLHKVGGAFTLFVELVVPFGYFAPSPVAEAAGLLTIAFQLVLILSGNLSWLNWLTAIVAISCFRFHFLGPPLVAAAPLSTAHTLVLVALAVAVVGMSVYPVRNMISRHQLMNFSYNPLHLVSTYGAFGSVDRERLEVVLEGAHTLEPEAAWRAYEHKGKPGDPGRRPRVISPYHLRLDWLMWFLPKGDPFMHPWVFALVDKLLAGDAAVLRLFAHDPFHERPPRYVRARLYLYRFAPRGDRSRTWTREELGLYLPPLTRDATGRLALAREAEAHPPSLEW